MGFLMHLEWFSGFLDHICFWYDQVFWSYQGFKCILLFFETILGIRSAQNLNFKNIFLELSTLSIRSWQNYSPWRPCDFWLGSQWNVTLINPFLDSQIIRPPKDECEFILRCKQQNPTSRDKFIERHFK